MVSAVAQSEMDTIFECNSQDAKYVSDEELSDYCDKVNKPHEIQSNVPILDLIRDVRSGVVVLHSRVAKIYRQNVTWNNLECEMTSNQYFLELDNFCIFKDDAGNIKEINPDYQHLSHVTRVYAKCPFIGLKVGQELIIASHSLGVDNHKDDSADIIGEQKIELSRLFEATAEVVEQTARVCGMEKARVPDDVPKDNVKYTCPQVIRDKGFQCESAAGNLVTSHVALALIATLHVGIGLW